jgi:PPP family 3-phenylpropionic acid transporter
MLVEHLHVRRTIGREHLARSIEAISFGAAHLGAMDCIGRHVPPARSATAQSFYSATVFGLFLGTMLYSAGWLYEALAGAAYLPMAGAGVLGAACARPLMRPRETATSSGSGPQSAD